MAVALTVARSHVMAKLLINVVRLTLPALILVVLVLELFFRLVIPASDQPMGWFDESQRIYRFDTRRPTGVVTIGRFAQQRGRWHINNAGWNSPVDYVRSKTKPRIAIIGDSYIEAWHVDSNESYPSKLRVLLGDAFDVYSFGVSGAPLSQYLHMARYAVEQYDPDLLIFTIIHNDFDESLRRINTGSRHFMLLDIQDGRVSETTPEPDPSFVQYNRTKRLLRRSALVRYLTFNLQISGVLDRLRQRRVEYVANIDPAAIARDQDDVRRAMHYVGERMATEFKDRRIVFVMDGPRSAIYANTFDTLNESVQFLHTLTAEVCAENGISLLDLSVPMRKAYAENGRHFESEWDFHWNEYGHEYVARAVADLLEEILPTTRATYEGKLTFKSASLRPGTTTTHSPRPADIAAMRRD